VPSEALAIHGKGSILDLNGDGLLDLVLHFNTQETGIKCEKIFAFLSERQIADKQLQVLI